MVSTLGLGMVFAAVLTWAISSIGYKFALGSVGTNKRDPIASMGVRIIIVALIMTIVTLIMGDFKGLFTMDAEKAKIYWFYAGLSGLITLLGDVCYFFALRFIDSSRVYPLINCQMLFTYPIAFFFLGENIPQLMWIAALLIIIGVFFVGDPKAQDKGMDNLSPEIKRKNLTIGILLGIGTGFFFGMQYITMAMQNRAWEGAIESNYTRILFYGIMIWSFIFLKPKHLPKLNSKETKDQFKAYCLMGIFGSLSLGIGDSLYQIGIIENGAALSITIASAAPLLNQIFAILFLKEKFRARFLIGVILIVVANILVIY